MRVRGMVGAMDSWNPSDIPVVEKLAPKEPERFAGTSSNAPEPLTLAALISRARKIPATTAQVEESRRSFTYGNLVIENPAITRTFVDRIADENPWPTWRRPDAPPAEPLPFPEAEDPRPLAPPVVERADGIDVTREEFARDPAGYLARARPGFSVTVVDQRGSPRMRLEVSPPIDESPDAA